MNTPLVMWDRLCPYYEQWGRPLRPIQEYFEDPETMKLGNELDEVDAFPTPIIEGMRARGSAALLVDAEDGSSRVTPYQISTFAELCCRFSTNTHVWEGVNHGSLIPYYISSNSEQRAEVFRLVRAGGSAAIVITENDHGSNLLRNEARAQQGRLSANGTFEPVGDRRAPFTHYRVTGQKDLINQGHDAPILTTLLRTSDDDGPFALTFFYIDRRPGIERGERWQTLPVRSAQIASIRFNGVVIPADRVIGHEGGGFAMLQKLMGIGRGGPAAMAVGLTEHGRQIALSHARTRNIYGEPIVRLGAISEHLIRMTALEAIIVSMSIKQTAMINLLGYGASYYSTVAKFLCPRLAEEAIDEGRRVLGGRALLRKLPYARVGRDVLLFGIFDGSQHVMLDSLKRYLGKPQPKADDQIDVTRRAFSTPPQPLVEVCKRPGPPIAPSPESYLRSLASLPGRISIEPLSRITSSLMAVVGALQTRNIWEQDQAIRFDATEILCGIEGLIALAEIADPERRAALGMPPARRSDATDAEAELVPRVAMGWFGARLASKIRALSYRAGIDASAGLERVERDLLSDQIDARSRLREVLETGPIIGSVPQ